MYVESPANFGLDHIGMQYEFGEMANSQHERWFLSVPKRDPYPLFTELGTQWTEHFRRTGECLFGRLLVQENADENLQDDQRLLLLAFGRVSTNVKIVVISSEDEQRFPLLKNAMAWSKSIHWGDNNSSSEVVFAAESVLEALDSGLYDHELMHVIGDLLSGRIDFYQESIVGNGLEYNPVLFPGFAAIRLAEDVFREGIVLLLEKNPTKMPLKELQQLMQTRKEGTVFELLSFLRKEGLRNDPKGENVRLLKELQQHIVLEFFDKLLSIEKPSELYVEYGYTIEQIRQAIQDISVFERHDTVLYFDVQQLHKCIVDILEMSPQQLLIENRRTEFQRHKLFRQPILDWAEKVFLRGSLLRKLFRARINQEFEK
jgi:hypothetical protein